MKTRDVACVLLLVGVALATKTPVHAVSGRVYNGTDYHIANEAGEEYLDTHAWYIEYYDTYTKNAVGKYAALTAAELHKATGLTVQATATVSTFGGSSCPGHLASGSHRILIKLDSATNRSYTYMCGLNNHSDSAKVMLSLPNWKSGDEIYKRHVVSHELGHALGLGHPASCAQPGADPLMCGDYWGGYWTASYAQQYTPYDIAGFKQLVRNRVL